MTEIPELIKDYYNIPILIGLFIIAIKSFVDNWGNTPLEEKLSSNLTKFQDRLVVSCLFLGFFTLLMFPSSPDWMWAFLVSFVLLVFSWILSILVLTIFIPRDKFSVEINNVHWELIKYSKGNGYLFKRMKIGNEDKTFFRFFTKEELDQKEIEYEKIPSRIKRWFS